MNEVVKLRKTESTIGRKHSIDNSPLKPETRKQSGGVVDRRPANANPSVEKSIIYLSDSEDSHNNEVPDRRTDISHGSQNSAEERKQLEEQRLAEERKQLEEQRLTEEHNRLEEQQVLGERQRQEDQRRGGIGTARREEGSRTHSSSPCSPEQSPEERVIIEAKRLEALHARLGDTRKIIASEVSVPPPRFDVVEDSVVLDISALRDFDRQEDSPPPKSARISPLAHCGRSDEYKGNQRRRTPLPRPAYQRHYTQHQPARWWCTNRRDGRRDVPRHPSTDVHMPNNRLLDTHRPNNRLRYSPRREANIEDPSRSRSRHGDEVNGRERGDNYDRPPPAAQNRKLSPRRLQQLLEIEEEYRKMTRSKNPKNGRE